MSELATRNAQAVMETLKKYQETINEQRERIVNVERQVSMHSAEINTLRQMVVTALASRGTGPTSR